MGSQPPGVVEMIQNLDTAMWAHFRRFSTAFFMKTICRSKVAIRSNFFERRPAYDILTCSSSQINFS